MLSIARRPRPRAALVLLLAIAVPLSACRSVELTEESSPGTVGSVKVHIHNGLFDEVPQAGYTVELHRGALGMEPAFTATSTAEQPVWFRAVSPGPYYVVVSYGAGGRKKDVALQEVSVRADTIASLRIESRAHDGVEITGSRSVSLSGATAELFKAVGYGLVAVVWVGVVVGAATAPVWVPLALGKKKDD